MLLRSRSLRQTSTDSCLRVSRSREHPAARSLAALGVRRRKKDYRLRASHPRRCIPRARHFASLVTASGKLELFYISPVVSHRRSLWEVADVVWGVVCSVTLPCEILGDCLLLARRGCNFI